MHESRFYMIFAWSLLADVFGHSWIFDEYKSTKTKNMEYHAIRTLKLWKSVGFLDHIIEGALLLRPNLTARN